MATPKKCTCRRDTELYCMVLGWGLESKVSSRQNCCQSNCSFVKSPTPPPYRRRQALFILPWWFPEALPHPTWEPTELIPVAFPYKQPVLVCAVDLTSLKVLRTPNKEGMSQNTQYILLRSTKTDKSGSQPQWVAYPLLGTSKPIKSGNYLQVTL